MKEAGKPDFFYMPAVIFTLMQVIAFYLTVYVLYPRFLLKKRIGAYLLCIFLMCLAIACSYLITAPLFGSKKIDNIWVHITIKFFISAAVMATGTCYMLIVYVIKEQRLQQENLKTELSFLRSQVSPHFMFNTLNSMVALARKKSDKLEPALMELSNLMHYMLYESDQEKVGLAKEIDYIQSYIDLQTLRFGHKVKIAFNAEAPPRDPSIEPMLLIPLIENAFKHGIGFIEEPEINIHLRMQDDWLLLDVRNKYNNRTAETKDKTSGIGLVNLERRLDLLYPDKYTLSAVKNGVYFKALLKINVQ
jgi:two-component system LytT family sensor kinase